MPPSFDTGIKHRGTKALHSGASRGCAAAVMENLKEGSWTMLGTEETDREYLRMMGEAKPLKMLESFSRLRPSVAERIANGKALRKSIPRRSHGDFVLRSDRTDPIAIIAEQNATRIPRLVPVRNSRMAASSFAFLRGSAAVMAHDLVPTPRTGLEVMACGDMHVGNFGVFASAERKLIFAINDFDEVEIGPWEWDLKRLAASAAVAARTAGGDAVSAFDAAYASVRSYVDHLGIYAKMGHLAIWYDQIDEGSILGVAHPDMQEQAKRALAKARKRGHMRALGRMTEVVDGRRRIIEDIPLVERMTHTVEGVPIEEAVDQLLSGYVASLSDDRRRILSRYRLVDVVRKVVGVGSVGLGCWVLMFEGMDTSDPLFLQVKEARRSVLAPYMRGASPFRNQGKRVVVGQRIIQGSPDIFIGWGPEKGGGDRAYYVRQLADMKGSYNFSVDDPASLGRLQEYCRVCGWALALAHAKSGDPAVISGYCGQSDALPEAIARFAVAYADQMRRDHEAFASWLSRANPVDGAGAPFS